MSGHGLSYLFTGWEGQCSDAPGETFFFDHNGRSYFVECWATQHSGGQDVYDEETGALDTEISDDPEFENALERARHVVNELFQVYIQPAQQQMLTSFREQMKRL